MGKNKSVAVDESYANLVSELLEDKAFTTKKKIVEQAIKLFYLWKKSPDKFKIFIEGKENQPHVHEEVKEVQTLTSDVLRQLPVKEEETVEEEKKEVENE